MHQFGDQTAIPSVHDRESDETDSLLGEIEQKQQTAGARGDQGTEGGNTDRTGEHETEGDHPQEEQIANRTAGQSD